MFRFSFLNFPEDHKVKRWKSRGPVRVSALCSAARSLWWKRGDLRGVCVFACVHLEKEKTGLSVCVCVRVCECVCVCMLICVYPSAQYVQQNAKCALRRIEAHFCLKKCKKAKWASSYERCVSGTKRTECCTKRVFFFFIVVVVKFPSVTLNWHLFWSEHLQGKGCH